ncbi:hypothetical protein I6E68_02590 [Salinibacterium sp. NSLL150]|uniref:hypothetical protein n=1 Tax=unclassified Salinibacterium TaxID=2632331 RepID=UPI0018CD11F8|nr:MULTISPECIES: hypothetical protein [unclassified Salinibacterium]MBH0098025.1 hypothetical protein [Salinibacterium sp. NSLL35]MBH0100780.1 hypothetical protein [Salinibacterium sp. NSLL150]MBH0103539.1 hypothetical protein [Salinibacterium sp. NSLL16]MBH0106300.1 hypothetical protein [Salinibacterium sp. NSLL17]
MSRVFRFADRGIMKRATLIEGFVLIVLGMLVMGGVLLNLASNNYEGQWRACTDHTSRPDGLGESIEYRIIPSFSLFPLGFNCEYSPYPPSEESATVFLDQGTVPAIFGIALTWIGGGVLIGGAVLARRAD